MHWFNDFFIAWKKSWKWNSVSLKVFEKWFIGCKNVIFANNWQLMIFFSNFLASSKVLMNVFIGKSQKKNTIELQEAFFEDAFSHSVINLKSLISMQINVSFALYYQSVHKRNSWFMLRKSQVFSRLLIFLGLIAIWITKYCAVWRHAYFNLALMLWGYKTPFCSFTTLSSRPNSLVTPMICQFLVV